MSKPITPNYLPWLRTGLAAYITDKAQNGLAPDDTAYVAVSVNYHASGTGDDADGAVQSPAIRLRGPGEVVGIASDLITRHDPEIGTDDAESNYLALIEFSAADLPWRYTPAAASQGRLQPWIALVVVEEREGVWLETGLANRLPVLHVDDIARELPDLNQCWAWAHVQADHDLAGGVAAAYAEQPEAFRSRLLCPRHLQINRSWLACVVPTFESGRLAGLGENPETDTLLAWDTSATGELRLPVYHYWRFQTGKKGDIELLMRRLKPRELPETVGRRDLDISNPGGGLPIIRNVTISYQGALVSTTGSALPWPKEPRALLKTALRKLLNAEIVSKTTPSHYDALRDDPVVGPPAYAAPQAGTRVVPEEGATPVWFGELNTEPQHRTVAGLGAAVIRNDQEALMAKAWDFAAGAKEANPILNRSRTAWEVARRARPRFDTLSDEMLVQIAAPAMARLQYSSTQTVKGAATGSALPSGLLSGAFRRLTHSVNGFIKTTPSDRVPTTASITKTAITDTLDFVGTWATVKSPINADVDDVESSLRQPRAARILVNNLDIPWRVEVVTIPYSGNVDPVKSLASKTSAALDPMGMIKTMVEARITGLSPTRDQDVPDRLAVRPKFTNAMYRRLSALSVEYLVPGVGDIPNDTVGLLETNPPFIEAYMAGLNYEMGREFLWREFPARLDDTWFQHFWEGGKGGANDILQIRNWSDKTALGKHAPAATPQASLVLLIRSAILKRYPDIRVYATEAAWKVEDGIYSRIEAENGVVKTPIFSAQLTTDITVFGFELEEDEARGSTSPKSPPGYFFVLEQQPGSLRFGLDLGEVLRPENAPAAWPDLHWKHLAGKGPMVNFIDVNGPSWLVSAGALSSNSDSKGAKSKDVWGDDAAAMARITFQQPVRMLIHADAMLPEPNANVKVK